MAKELDDGEFWLPSGFLTDDELLTDFSADRFRTKPGDDFSHGFWCSSGFSSDLSSPVESFMGSTETESDEDDFIAFLTRKIAYSTLKDSNISSEFHEHGLKLSGSPQSTLYGYKPGSSRGSPKCVSQVPSPMEVKDPAGWYLLYAAAREVARMRASQETKAFYSTKPSPFVPQTNPSIMPGIYSNHKTQVQISQQHMQAANFQKTTRSGIWGQEKLGNPLQNGRNVGERRNGLSVAAWPTLQQSRQQPPMVPRSGMRDVRLGENGAKKERTGTGVFLPRRYETTPPEIHKKPERVVHGLNLNLESIDIPLQAHFKGISSIKPEYGATLKPMSRIRMAQQREFGPQPVMNQELWLPQEWSY